MDVDGVFRKDPTDTHRQINSGIALIFFYLETFSV